VITAGRGQCEQDERRETCCSSAHAHAPDTIEPSRVVWTAPRPDVAL
jgi:hypothetical protein